MRKMFAALLLVMCGSPAVAQLMTVCVEVPGPNAEVVLKPNGEIFIDLPWPVPNQTVMLPGWIMPPNACPVGKKTVNATGPSDAKPKVAGCIAGYLIAKWIKHVSSFVLGGSASKPGPSFSTFLDLSRAPQAHPGRPAGGGDPTAMPAELWSPTWGRELVDLIVAQVAPYVP